ncbi:hypothetical protein RIF29_15374 [Crotalaria pallida]|uniref:Uncharacterized protein n=1 Tax=Crotalaria pallida TaxID=3830 RepID=A0AAN9FH45_CROPI
MNPGTGTPYEKVDSPRLETTGANLESQKDTNGSLPPKVNEHLEKEKLDAHDLLPSETIKPHASHRETAKQVYQPVEYLSTA